MNSLFIGLGGAGTYAVAKKRAEVTFHQPFLDKRFWECKDANIVQLFREEAIRTSRAIR